VADAGLAGASNDRRSLARPAILTLRRGPVGRLGSAALAGAGQAEIVVGIEVWHVRRATLQTR